MTTSFPRALLTGLGLAVLAAASVRASIQASYYVDPVNGSDSNNGTSSTSAFATLPRAQTAVEGVNSSMTGDIMVYLMPGDYLVTSPINLTQADAGTNGHNIIWTSYGARGTARLIGGVKVTGWTLYSGNIYQASVSLPAQRLEALWENGVRGRLGRVPTSGYYVVNADDATTPSKKFQWKSGDTIPTVAKPTDLQVYIWPGSHDWSTEIHDVASLDRTNRWITLTTGMQQPYLGNPVAGSRYYLQGALELVTQPGDFYYDSSAGILYYYPRTTPLSSQEVIVPTTTTLFSAVPSGTLQLDGWWQFENNAEDSSVAGNDGTAINSPTYLTGVMGQAISLDGSTQYVSVPDTPYVEFGPSANPFTLSAWISTTATSLQPIVTVGRPTNDNTQDIDYKFWLNSSGQLELNRWNKPNSTSYTITDTSGTNVHDGAWHHVVFVNESGTSHKLYIDGNLVQTSTATWTYNDSNQNPVEIGRFIDTPNTITDYFAGALDDVRIYQSALSASDVTALYNLANPGPPPLANVAFTNLKFVATNLDYTVPSGTNQGMLFFQDCAQIQVLNNDFENIGGSGVNIQGPGTNITVSGNYVEDAGDAGIALGSVTSSTVSNNRVHKTAQIFADAGANLHFDTVSGVTVANNTLWVSKRHGIRMHGSHDNTIAYNEVSGETTDSQDCGAVYFGYSDSNTFDHNRVHDSGSFGQQQHGFYVEDGSDLNTLTNNIVWNIGPGPSDASCEPINLKGVKNLIQNNFLDFTGSHGGIRTYEILANAPANNETIQENILYSGSSSANSVTLYYFQSYAANRIKASDYNLFFKTATGSYVMYNIPGGDTLSNWKTIQSSKYDQHSQTGNPLFVDPANHNYALQSGSPAPGLGISPIDVSQIGILPSFVWPSTSGQWIFSGSAADISLSGNDGTLVGSPSYVSDRFGNAASALSLNGSTQYLNVPANSLLDFGDPSLPFTIVAWVNTTSASAGGIVAKARDSNTVNMDYRLDLQAGGTVSLSRWNQSAGVTESVTETAVAINDGQWHQVAFVNVNASSHLLYIDGVLQATSSTTWLYNDANTEPLRVGRDHNGTTSDFYLGGTVDDVAVIDRALIQQEIQDLNHQPHP